VTAIARAFWIGRPGQGELRDEPIETPGPNDVVVRARFSGVSRGTEALVFQGRVPVSEHARMRAPFQRGMFPSPVKYGYASVGVVERGPDDLQGHHVFVLYPHQTQYVVPATAAHALPAGVPPERAVLAANLETAINAVWDGRPQVGDRVAVIGAGRLAVSSRGLRRVLRAPRSSWSISIRAEPRWRAPWAPPSAGRQRPAVTLTSCSTRAGRPVDFSWRFSSQVPRRPSLM